MSFCENLMRLRKQKGLSQEEFANEINVTRQTISKWELGISTPEMEKLMQIASFFGISVDDLLNADEAVDKVKNNESKADNSNAQPANDQETVKNEYVANKGETKSTKLLMVIIVIFIIAIFTMLVILSVREFKKSGENVSTSEQNAKNEVESVAGNELSQNNVGENVQEQTNGLNSVDSNSNNSGSNGVDNTSNSISNNQTTNDAKDTSKNTNSSSDEYAGSAMNNGMSDFSKNVMEKMERDSAEFRKEYEKAKKQIEGASTGIW